MRNAQSETKIIMRFCPHILLTPGSASVCMKLAMHSDSNFRCVHTRRSFSFLQALLLPAGRMCLGGVYLT